MADEIIQDHPAEKYAAWIVQNASKKGTPEFNTVAAAYQDALKLGAEPKASVEVTSPEGNNLTTENVVSGVKGIVPSLALGAAKPLLGLNQAAWQLAGKVAPSVANMGDYPVQKLNEYQQKLNQAAGPVASKFTTEPAALIGENVLPMTGMNKVATAIGEAPNLMKMIGSNALTGAALGYATPEKTGLTPEQFANEKAKTVGISAAIPSAVSGLSSVGSELASLLRGPEQTEQMAQAVKNARNVGYVIPPTQAKESLLNRMLEGTAGKITTQQNASAKNQVITHELAAQALGLPKDTVITPEILKGVRSEAANAYDALANLPVKPEVPASSVMNQEKVPEINPKQMVYDLRLARNNADAYYKAYQRSADPEQLTRAKQAKALASDLESQLEGYAASLGQQDLLPKLRDARQLIAKTYTVENALNPTSGTVDARKIAAELKKGKPLTDELKSIGQFAGQFPKASQTTEMMGSRPQISPVDVGVSGLAGVLKNPLLIGAIAVRPGARTLALSKPIQNNLVQGPASEITPEQANLAKLLMIRAAQENK